MIITCRSERAERLPDQYLEPRAILHRASVFPLSVGKSYVVYAIGLLREQTWFYIDDDDHLYYPKGYPAPLFEVIDSRVSKYWHFRYTPAHLDHTAILAFDEWATDNYFYDRLTDGEPLECRIYAAAKQRMDSEAGLLAR